MQRLLVGFALCIQMMGCAYPDPPPRLHPEPTYVDPDGYPWPIVRGTRDPDAATNPDRCDPDVRDHNGERSGCGAPSPE
jgi:hypothetical protein